MSEKQFFHKATTLYLMKRALQQYNSYERSQEWLDAVEYFEKNVSCPKFTAWFHEKRTILTSK